MSALHKAADALIQRQRMRLGHGDHQTWQTLPSLWEQLETATGYSAGRGGNGGYNSQPTISTAVVSLIIDVTKGVNEGYAEHTTIEQRSKRRRHMTIPDKIRAITASITDYDQRQGWAALLTDWTTEARAALRLDPGLPRSARGITCPQCGSKTAATTVDGERAHTPALAIIWHSPDDDRYHTDDEWRVRAVQCRHCNATWWRGTPDLDDLIEQMLVANRTRETMAVDSA